MKRTRQRFDRPEQDVPAFTSGCSQFEGEDLLYQQRLAYQAAQQKVWIEQQTQEHNDRVQAEIDEERAYADQTAVITRMRGMLQDESSDKKSAQLKALQEENKRIAQQKRDREAAWKRENERQNQIELANTVNHGLPTES